MTSSLTNIRRYITEFKFKPLFVEELGWEELRSAPLTVTVDGQVFTLRGVAEKRGLTLLQCDALPPYAVRRRIDHAVTKVHREHLIVFAAPDKSAQVWLWVRREPGKPAAGRERHYHRGETGERVAQTLAQISFSLDEEEELTLLSGVSRVKAAFDVDRVTKKFYDRFKKEHATFLQFIHGIPDDGFHRWYASVMLNRLMFVYFVQRKGFMDGDPHYLRARLAQAEQNNGNYYRDFLRVLFFQGFAVRESARSAAVNRLLGRVPYLDGGLFAVHPVEERYGDAIEIENAAFARLFAFFDDYNWHLDERPLRNDNEINPDVLGYIFEKYINQKQMGAYYTKEDITDYIGKNTILPYLLDAVRRDVPAAFDASADLDVMLAQLSAEGKLGSFDAEAQGRRGAQRENEGSFDAETQGRKGAQSKDGSSAHLPVSAPLRQVADNATVWRLLAEDPDRYIYPAMRHGVDLPLPETIAVGIDDVSRRTEWNRSAPSEYALPTEIWREVAARRQCYAEVRSKLTSGAVTRSDDLITLNLNIRQFVRDLLDACEDPALLRAFWRALRSLAVLDPTGGSGAFLFAALTILEDLYDACLERMEWFLAERGRATPTDTRLHDFQTTLAEAARHPNRRYFILKSIIVHNLYAVDIMEEAVEICKLRLFLKLVAQIERADQIEPLPDIDFNIRAGNTLVGFVSREDVRAALELEQTGAGAAQGRLIFGEEQRALDRIEQKAQEIDRAFASFRALQTQIDAPADAVGEAKAGLKAKLRTLEDELNRLLARVYGVEVEQDAEYRRWLASHKPFHWFVEFYGVLARGGFDVIVGNPPYVEYSKVKNEFAITGYSTIDGGNLYVFVLERAIRLLSVEGCLGMITPMSLVSTDRIATLRTLLLNEMDRVYLSNYSGDAHPSTLFSGVKMRLSIILGRKSSPRAGKRHQVKLWSSNFIKWFSSARSQLFDVLLSYQHVPTFAVRNSLIPKVGRNIESTILDKLFSSPVSLGSYVRNESTYNVYSHRIVAQFVKAFDFIPYFWNEMDGHKKSEDYKVFGFSSPREVGIISALLSSTTFYYYFVLYSDVYHCGRDLILNYPFDIGKLPPDQADKLVLLSHKLMDDFKQNSVRRRIKYRTGWIEYDEFYPRTSKPIIDEIDRVLARHYGFTDEELDYIINYDIKYRLGAEDEE